MKPFLFSLFAMLLITGCAPKEEPINEEPPTTTQQNLEPTIEEPTPTDFSVFAGNWSGKYESNGTASKASSKESNQISGMLRSYQATLVLNEDGTYRFVSMLGADPVEDTWDSDGVTVVLNSSGLSDFYENGTTQERPNGEKYTLSVASDGSLIGEDPLQQGSGAMIFRRD